MNMVMVDVGEVPNPQVGDEAVLIGQQGEETITADELAQHLNTINYEVVSRIQARIPRLEVT